MQGSIFRRKLRVTSNEPYGAALLLVINGRDHKVDPQLAQMLTKNLNVTIEERVLSSQAANKKLVDNEEIGIRSYWRQKPGISAI
jgi:hypothetical protein